MVRLIDQLDTFALYSLDANGNKNVRISLLEDNVSWIKDKTLKYKNLPENIKNIRQWLDIETDRFAIWMRASPTLNFRKIWGRVDPMPLKQGKYMIEVGNRIFKR